MTSGAQVILRCSKEQADILREIFKTKPYPSTYEKEAISRDLDLPRPFINNWFQRERNQYKKTNKSLPKQITQFETIKLTPCSPVKNPREMQKPLPRQAPIRRPAPMQAQLSQPTLQTERNPPMKPPRTFARGTFFPGLVPHETTVHSKALLVGSHFPIKQEYTDSPPQVAQLKRQSAFSKLPSIGENRAFELPRPSPSAFQKKKVMDNHTRDTFLEDHQPPQDSPATPGNLMIDENFVPSPLMSSSQHSSTLKSSPVTVKYADSNKTITNKENEKDKPQDETVLIETDIDVEGSPDSMLPPLKEKDFKDGEGATFGADEIEEGFAQSQMQEIAHLRQQVSAYRMTILQMNEYHNRMLHDFQAAMAYENFLRAKDAGVHPSMLFAKRFQ